MSSNKWQETFVTFMIGAGVGALVGILLAPKSGEETRKQVAGAAKDGYDGAVASGREMARRASHALDDLKERAEDVVDVGQKAYQQAKSIIS